MISTTKEWDSFISSGQNYTTTETCAVVVRAEEQRTRGCDVKAPLFVLQVVLRQEP